jgi:hypothetical protein
MANKTIDQQLQELDTLPEAELLVIPEQNIPAGLLAAIWERTAAVKERKEAADSVLGRDDRQQRAVESKEHERQRRREQAFERFEATMRDVQQRSDRLAERIAEQEILARDRLRQIDARAIVLKDGRRIFVGQNGDYLNVQGGAIEGKDRDEARALHKQNPRVATWAERTDAEQQYEQTRQLREKVQKLHEHAGKEDGEGLSAEELEAKTKDYDSRLSGYEKEFQRQTEDRTAALSGHQQITDDTYGGADYMAAYENTDRTTSYAAKLDGTNNIAALRSTFAPAATGQGTQAAVKPQPSATGTSPNSTPSM